MTRRGLAPWTPRIVAASTAAVLTAGVLYAQAPMFRTGVDVVIVEAIVLDKAGAVVKDLQPADFAVEVDGKAREIVLAELVEFTPPAKDAVPGDVDITTNAPMDAGRTVLLLIDQLSLRPESRGILSAAQRWVESLGPDDRVGLMTFPPSGPRVEFTTDHAKVAAVLANLVGSSPAPMPGFRNIGLSEAVRIYEGDTFAYQQAVARECRSADPLCPPDIRDQSRQMVTDAQSQVIPALNAMRTVIRGLAAIPGPKHAVLISAGWMVSERETMPVMREIAIQAARTNVTLHTFTDEQFGQAASRSRPSPTPFQDQQLVLSTVEALSGMTGGRAVRLTGSYDGAFAGLNAALSGYYRLGVRALPEDLGGKEHRISLKVRRQGASLASYRRVLVAPPATSSAPGDPAVSLRQAIEAGATLTTLGLRATTYVLHGTIDAHSLRVVVAGDVARAVTGKATLVAALYQLDGKPVVAREATLDVPADGSAPLAISLDAPPGSYALRLAVRDGEGRLGSLERLVEARWQEAGRIETPGLVLFRTAPGSPSTPVLDGVGAGDDITAQLALSGASQQARVEIDITAVGSQVPLVRRVPRIRETTSGQAVVHETVPASLLPPGRYTVRALVSGSDATFTRSFTVRAVTTPPTPAPAAAATATAASPSPSPSVPGPSATVVVKPPYSTTTVLEADFVGPLLDRLAARPEATSVRGALATVKAGPWPIDTGSGPLAPVPVAAQFVAGLGSLQGGDLEAAARAFRAVLKDAPDFTPALIYLGACYAAGGKDKEAAGAWQMALVRDASSPTLQRLAIEAWLRAEQPTPARALVSRARQRWPDDPAFAALSVQASLAEGKVREGLEQLRAIAQPDAATLLAALGVIYDAWKRQTPVWDMERDLETMRKLRDTYAARQGESLGLVDAWLVQMGTAPRP